MKKAGIAPRPRHYDRRWIQTTKTGANLHLGLSHLGRAETRVAGGRTSPEPYRASIVHEAVPHIDKAPLQRCEAPITRDSSELVHDARQRAEVAADRIESRGGEHPTRGPEQGPQSPRFSEAVRDLLLAEEGRTDLPLVPRDAQDIALDPAQTAEQAACDILGECLIQIATNVLVVRRLDNMEGPHQLRIGLRRLRSAFSVYGPVLQDPDLDWLDAEARWLSQEVGSLRDLDVVANDMVRREAGIHPDEPGLPALADVVLRQAQARRQQLCALLAGARVQVFLMELARFVETHGWLASQEVGQPERLAVPVIALAGKALRKRWKKVIKHARGLEALTVDERHDLRKDLKKLRYAVEFFSSLFPEKHVGPFLKRLKKLQTLFGDLNDAAMARTLFTGPDIPGTRDPAVQHAIGWMIGASQARADFGWTGAKGLWRDLEKSRLFWR